MGVSGGGTETAGSEGLLSERETRMTPMKLYWFIVSYA